jgi:hypothetical protein
LRKGVARYASTKRRYFDNAAARPDESAKLAGREENGPVARQKMRQAKERRRFSGQAAARQQRRG